MGIFAAKSRGSAPWRAFQRRRERGAAGWVETRQQGFELVDEAARLEFLRCLSRFLVEKCVQVIMLRVHAGFLNLGEQFGRQVGGEPHAAVTPFQAGIFVGRDWVCVVPFNPDYRAGEAKHDKMVATVLRDGNGIDEGLVGQNAESELKLCRGNAYHIAQWQTPVK
jgi:hypothetical protein